MTTMSEMIKNQWLAFDTDANPCDIHIQKKESESYGVLSFNTPTLDATTESMLYHIKVDVSGSMSDRMLDGRCKMQLVVHTLTNMMHYFADNTVNTYIQVSGFDDKIHPYIEPTKVTTKNVHSLIRSLSSMRPMNTTNIELALATVAEYVDEPVENIPRNRRVVVLLTDGDSTVGESDPYKLSQLIPSGVSANFIALGDEHNADIMYALGHQNPYTSNWFINKLEHTGNVYGEIIFNESHRALDDVLIQIENGRIFDYNTGEFVSEIRIGILSSEMKKQFHILSETPDTCNVSIKGRDIRDGTHVEYYASDLPPLIPCGETLDEPIGVQRVKKQYMRLGVQKLMADLRLCDELNQPIPNMSLRLLFHEPNPCKDNTHVRKAFNDRAKNLKATIKEYMESSSLTEDELLCGLIDDLNVVMNTTSLQHGDIKFATAREDSQGRQTAFNTVSDMQDDDYDISLLRPPTLHRTPTSAYTTPGRLNAMRAISREINDAPVVTPDELIWDTQVFDQMLASP